MDLAEIWRVMCRRWYVLLPGLLLTAALIAGVYLLVPVEYRSQSTVTLLNSKKATVAFDGNPFLSTQASLTGMADGLARNLNSDDSKADLRSQGLTGEYEAKIADNAQGPFMWLSVTGTRPDAVLKSDEIFTAYAEKRLREFQAQQSVQPEAMIRMATIVPPQTPEAQTKTRLQYLVMAGALGFVLSLVATFFVEARRRQAGRQSRRRPESEPPPATTGSGRRPGSAASSEPAGTARAAGATGAAGTAEASESAESAESADPTATMALTVLPPSAAYRSTGSP
ncbi:chain length determinant protein [Streptomyces sp. ISL-66]|uniref:chain length determinant protein n=1 Tax=Streptomyces sp. ISL-66 TaxID=2819186 RepID=UPI001BE51D8B|nr:chain length determinant protein [Streptomyces sp. ISL-66]MBT2468178.1 chain length determinant protein [Streptomyces sp. ISL-66]